MGCRRRSAHRPHRSFLTVTAAETEADVQTLTRRVERAIQEAEILGLPDVRHRLDEALTLVVRHAAGDEAIAGEAHEARSLGQHDPSD